MWKHDGKNKKVIAKIVCQTVDRQNAWFYVYQLIKRVTIIANTVVRSVKTIEENHQKAMVTKNY